MSKDTTLFHLPLDEIRRDRTTQKSTIANVGGLNSSAILHGNPYVAHDSEMGTCMRFDGVDDYIEFTDLENFKFSSGFTFCVWVKHYKLKAWQRIFDFSPQLNDDAKAIYLTAGRSENQLHFEINKAKRENVSEILENTWQHFSVSVENSGNTKIYVNGEEKDSGNLSLSAVSSASFNYAFLGKSHHENGLPFQGLMGHFRYYSRKLEAQEINSVMQQDKAAMAKVRETTLLKVDLYTIRDDDHKPILYIEAEDKGEPLEASLSNPHIAPVKFIGTGNPSESNYHIQWRFRRNVISGKYFTNLQNTRTKEITIGGTTWKYAAGTSTDNREDYISFIRKDGAFQLATGQTTLIRLDDFNAEPRGGARNTRVEIRFRTEAQNPGSIIRHMEVQSHLGMKTIPLIARVKGSNTVLNDGEEANELTIEIIPTQKEGKVQLNNKTKFDLVVDNVLIQGTLNGNSTTSGVNPQTAGSDGGWRSQEFSVQDNNVIIDRYNPVVIQLTNWKIPKPTTSNDNTGTHNIMLRYSNIENYWDGAWVIPVNLSPLVIEGGNIGMGTDDPQEKAHVEGNMLIDGQLLIGDREKYKTALEAFKNEYTDSGSETFKNEPGIIFAPDHGNTDHAWLRFHSRSGSAHNLEIQVAKNGKDHLVLNPQGGNVGIGTDNPIAKLDIQTKTRTEYQNKPHPTSINGLYVTGDFSPDRNGVEFRHTNGSQGIGFGYNTIYATGNNTNQDLNLKPRGTGKVGIGTISPGAKLHIHSDENGDYSEVARFSCNAKKTLLTITQKDGSNKDIGIENDEGKLHFWTSEPNKSDNFWRMTILQDGRVGIGTSSPSEQLDVDGNIKAKRFIGMKLNWGPIQYSGWLNDWDKEFNWKVPDGHVMVGLHSYHSNSKEDRRFEIRYRKVWLSGG